jgi:imidazole glycerol-phosphate synthase subunit HisF
MKRIRVIPVLLIQRGGLVKSVKFNNHKYVGDPINAVKIFNEKEVDEIVILDISATKERRPPNMQQIKEIAGEAFMPLGYGGGITTLEEIAELITAGVEKVVLNTSAYHHQNLVREGAKHIGSQSIVVSIDVKKNVWGRYRVYIENGSKGIDADPVEYAKKMQDAGAGEIFLNAIDRDGTYMGYDLNLIESITRVLQIPLIACGGAATVEDFAKAVHHGASAVAAGSIFVFQRPHKAVLISYPSQEELHSKVFQYLE